VAERARGFVGRLYGRGELLPDERVIEFLRGAQPAMRSRGTDADYVRGPGQATWHWCPRCSSYPGQPRERRRERPEADLCDECRARERAGTC
jgi:hypothetical protein